MVSLAGSGSAPVLGAGIDGELWLRPADGEGWQALAAAAVFALTSVLGIVWQSRARGIRQWRAAPEADAERQIARRSRRKKAPQTAARCNGRNSRT